MSEKASKDLEGLPPLTESESDNAETLMTYDDSSRFPIYLAAVWIVGLLGLGVYMFSYYFSDLARWGAP